MPRQRRPYMAAREHSQREAEAEEPERSTLGRPSEYTPEIGMQICERLVEGETLRKICFDPEMPGRSTIFRWMARNEQFRDYYKIAIELHADNQADMALEIASDRAGDYIEKAGKLIPDWENVQRSRLRVDTIKWRTAKLYPKKYSDRFQMSGPDEKPLNDAPLMPLMPDEVTAQFTDTLDKMEADMGLPASTEDPEARIKAILASGEPIPPELYFAFHKRKAG
jgi:hypothetical protein